MWDPVLLIAQIVSLQSLHYLTLSVVLPPLLYTFTDSRALAYTHGGSATVGMVMDWRDMAGRSSLEHIPTLAEQTKSWWTSSSTSSGAVEPLLGHGDLDAHVDPALSNKPSWANDGTLTGGWRLSLEYAPEGRHNAERHLARSLALSSTSPVSEEDLVLLSRRDEPKAASPLAEASIRDPLRGWIIALGWIITSFADIGIIYTLIRRPTLVLDFSLTLLLNHTILTTYYASSFPTSLFFWLVMGGNMAFIIIVAEQMCVKREMTEGLKSITARGGRKENQAPEDIELLVGSSAGPSSRRQSMTPGQEELFNARLASGKLDVGADSDSDLDIEPDGDEDALGMDMNDREWDEEIEALERGSGLAPSGSSSGPPGVKTKAKS